MDFAAIGGKRQGREVPQSLRTTPFGKPNQIRFAGPKLIAGFEARFTINRLDYQVGPGRYVEMGVIGDKVDILITLEVVKPKK